MGHPVDELRMNMPISLRTSADESNAVTIARFEIPVSNMIDDVLETAANTVRSWRAEPALKMADYLAELSRFLPPELVSAAAQTSDLTASNARHPGAGVAGRGQGGADVSLGGHHRRGDQRDDADHTNAASVGISSDDAAVGDRAELLESLRLGFAEVLGEGALVGIPSADSDRKPTPALGEQVEWPLAACAVASSCCIRCRYSVSHRDLRAMRSRWRWICSTSVRHRLPGSG